MLDFFIEGGFAMWPILAFGGIFLFVAVRFAIRPDRAHLPMLGLMGGATLTASLVGVFVDIAQVMSVLGGPKFAGHPEWKMILLQGIKECTRPGTFGGGLVVLGCVIAAIGAARLARRT